MTICMGKTCKKYKHMKLANMLLSSQWSQRKKIKEEIFVLMPGDFKNKDTILIKSIGPAKSTSVREV